MNLSDYQHASRRTLSVDWSERDQIANAALGLAGEAGEIADYLKKVLYHGHELDFQRLIDELGDLFWYLAALCSLHGISLNDVARFNIDKLRTRYPNGFTKEDSVARIDKRT